MTKAAELKLLDETIARFGPDSYIGPWLKDARDQIVSDITNDVCISVPLPGAAREYARGFIETTKADAQRIIADAKVVAQNLREDAQESAAATLRTARERLESLVSRLR